jgi:multidrug resistance efflux pump
MCQFGECRQTEAASNEPPAPSTALARSLPFWAAVVVLVVVSAADQAKAVEAITKPSGDVKLSFVQSGLIGRVLVREGQAVEAGEVLMEQDDKVEQVQKERLKAQADDQTNVDYYVAQRDQKKVYLKRITEVDRNATTPTEVEMAQLDVKVAELSLQLAIFNHTQEQRKYREFQAQVERMRIRSPISGKVEQISLKEGEAADALAPILRVVSIDPLWIDVPVQLDEARCLTVGTAAQVGFPPPVPAGGVSSAPAVSVEGKIIHVGAVAEAASNTLLVRVEAPNASARPAGERVEVTFQPADQGKGANPTQAPTTQPHSSSDNKKE